MVETKEKWNPPSWPWELELITFSFFLIALLTPYYFHDHGVDQSLAGIAKTSSINGLSLGQNALSTQFGFLWATGIVILYIFHLTFSFAETNRITTSPSHLLAPILFSIIAYYRIAGMPNLHQSPLNAIDGSFLQVAMLVVVVGLITFSMARLRTYRYMINFDDVQWDITSPAPYDMSYSKLLLQLRPLLYAPRRYHACNEGILVEGWFYAMPIGFNSMHAIGIISRSSSIGTGNYYASSAHHLVRIEMHDSLKPTYLSPLNREDFVRYCSQHIMRKRPTKKTSASRHGLTRASDTHAAGETRDKPTASATNPTNA